MSRWDEFMNEERVAAGEQYQIDNQGVIARVRAAGFEVLIAGNDQLFLDIDSEEDWEYFLNRWGIVSNYLPVNKEYEVRPSIGGLPGRHVIIHLPEPMPLENRIAWQAVLGSDRKKEFNNLLGSFLCPV